MISRKGRLGESGRYDFKLGNQGKKIIECDTRAKISRSERVSNTNILGKSVLKASREVGHSKNFNFYSE